MAGTRKIVDKTDAIEFGIGGTMGARIRTKRTVSQVVAETVGLISESEADAVTAAEGFVIVSRRKTGECFWTVVEEGTEKTAWEPAEETD